LANKGYEFGAVPANDEVIESGTGGHTATITVTFDVALPAADPVVVRDKIVPRAPGNAGQGARHPARVPEISYSQVEIDGLSDPRCKGRDPTRERRTRQPLHRRA